MATFEEEITALLDSGHVTPKRAMDVITRHTKRVKNWSKFLRRLADVIEAQPERFELSQRDLSRLVQRVLDEEA